MTITLTRKVCILAFFASGDWIQKFFDPKRSTNKISSAMPFTFNAVELCVVTINEKPWACAREVCRALEYGKVTKTTNVIKTHVTPENYAHKWQLSSVSAGEIPFNWPKYPQKYNYYINEEGMTELLVGSQQPLAKELAEYMGIKIYLSKEFRHGLAAFVRDYKT